MSCRSAAVWFTASSGPLAAPPSGESARHNRQPLAGAQQRLKHGNRIAGRGRGGDDGVTAFVDQDQGCERGIGRLHDSQPLRQVDLEVGEGGQQGQLALVTCDPIQKMGLFENCDALQGGGQLFARVPLNLVVGEKSEEAQWPNGQQEKCSQQGLAQAAPQAKGRNGRRAGLRCARRSQKIYGALCHGLPSLDPTLPLLRECVESGRERGRR